MARITAVCLTLGRPHLLAQMIRQFELQTYQDRELLIIDTGNHIQPQTGDRWRLRQLGRVDTEMWRTMNELVRETDTEFVCKMDDDDNYAPWHMAAVVDALDRGPWAVPSVVWDNAGAQVGAPLVATATHAPGRNDHCYAGAWAYRRAAFDAVGGYSPHGVNEGECEFRNKLLRTFGPPADTISERYPQPSYIYRRGRSWQASLLQNDPRETMRLRTAKYEPVGVITPTWPDNYLEGLPTDGVVHPRAW